MEHPELWPGRLRCDAVEGLLVDVVGLLLERERELAVFDEALASSRSGAGRVVLVEAAAGRGKTALLSAAARRAAGFRALAARGGEFERSAGFGVVRELYGPGVAGHSTTEDVLAGAAKLATPLFGGDMAALAALDAAALNHGLYWLTANLVAERPVLLVVDDVQWADVASLRYLEYLAVRIESLGCVLALAWRPGEPDGDEAFAGRILALDATLHVALQPLTRAGSRALILERLPCGSDELVDRCHAASAGNPFLLGELARAVVARSAAGDEALPLEWLSGAPGHGAGDSVPQRLIRIVRARVSRLPRPGAAIAEALAVLGPQAALRHAAGVAGVTRDAAARAADALAAADLIRPQARIDFVHPLIRRAIYDMQPAAARAEAHGRAARLLAAEHVDAEVIAGHLLAAPCSGDEAVVDWLMGAARTAISHGAPDAAITYLLRALEEPPRPADRVQILRALGNAKVRAGDRDGLLHLQEAHSRSADPGERLGIALDAAHAAVGWGPAGLEEIVTRLPAALDEGQRHDPEAALLARSLLLAATVPTASAQWRRFALEAHQSYREADDGVGRRVLAASLAFTAAWSNEPSDNVRVLARHALADDGAYDRALAAGWQLTWCCPALAVSGDWELAERRLTQALMSGQQRGALRAVRSALWARMAVRALRGDLSGAETDAQQALELHRDPQWHSLMFVMFGAQLIEVLIDRASPAAAQQLLDKLSLDSDRLDAPAVSPQLLCCRSRLRLVQGRTAEAVADAETAREVLAHAALNPIALYPVQERAASAFAAAGLHERAHAAADEALRLATSLGTPATIGTATRCGALLQRGDEQVRQLRAAVELLASSGRRVEHARTLIDLGAAMRRQGERAAARTPLSEGREIAHRCGAHALAQHATQELLATGARPRRIMRSGAESLTASERRVAELAADGLTSRTIAERLFVTQKTVETHLGHIYRKLDIPGRQHIAQALTSDVTA